MERRDLQGLVVMSPSGHEAVAAKGGLLRLDGRLEVRFLYRGSTYSIDVVADMPATVVRQAIADCLTDLDEMLDLADLVGWEVEV